ncbi:hypothetical protein [Paenibacillus sp. V4I7]|nr:hypothetical protein [Paenibacillus sp. V4I7]MDQ0901555.1 nucleoside-diphosphate-sugar epimerase [Paenibacillus sp. V4I7]
MKVVVTGGADFIGSHLVDALVSASVENLRPDGSDSAHFGIRNI